MRDNYLTPPHPKTRSACFLLAWQTVWWILILPWGAVAAVHALTRSETRKLRLWRLHRQMGGAIPPQSDPFLQDTRPLIWLHAVSVGELNAALPLLNALANMKNNENKPRFRFLVTTTTISSLHLAHRNFTSSHPSDTHNSDTNADTATRANARANARATARASARAIPSASVRHAILPFDHPLLIQRFIHRWQPKLMLFSEGDLWPSLVKHLSIRNIPIAVVSARHSPRSRRRWLRYQTIAQAIYGRVNLILARYPEEMEYFKHLSNAKVVLAGEIKDAAPPPIINQKDLNILKPIFATRPRWAAISIHEGELQAILNAHQKLAKNNKQLLTVICPRHPIDSTMRFFTQQLNKAKIPFTRRSQGQMPLPENSVYLADTFGEIGLWSALVPAAFVGGSLIDNGGHNLREPAWGAVALFGGKSFYNQAVIADALTKAGALVGVDDGNSLAAALQAHLREAGTAGTTARQYVEKLGAETLNRTLAALTPLLNTIDVNTIDETNNADNDTDAD